jgi:hypothetical protein
MENSEVVSTELECDGLDMNGKITNNISGCECKPKYKATQTWKDGRIRLSTGVICDISPNLMLDPDGTYRVQVDEDLSSKEDREGMEDARAGCEIWWNGKKYKFGGYY